MWIRARISDAQRVVAHASLDYSCSLGKEEGCPRDSSTVRDPAIGAKNDDVT